MKVLVAVDDADLRHGYRNVLDHEPDWSVVPGVAFRPDGTVVPPPVDYVVVASLTDFGETVFAGEADELTIPNALEYVEPGRTDATLTYWMSRLAIGGLLTIGGVDLLLVADLIATGRLSEAGANMVLFGNERVKRLCYSSETIRNLLEQQGLTIERVELDGLRYLIQARRTS